MPACRRRLNHIKRFPAHQYHIQPVENRKRILVSPPALSPRTGRRTGRYLSRGPRKGMRQDRSPSLGVESTYLASDLPSQKRERRTLH
ncbi:hypothetical protein C8Q77DRAFT_518279 [Trametes polyzona]|nr:hypothetical protein C8Q77DRAFT_518279 [Trametes polyzona]